MFHQFLQKPCLWYGKPIAPVRKHVVVCRRNHPARLSLAASFAARTSVGSWVVDIFMSLEHVCSSWLFWDAVCPRCRRLWQQKGLQLPGARIQWHFAAGSLGWRYSERRLHFGRRGLILLARINFCWCISAMHRNLRQLMLTSDCKAALHWPGCSYDASQASAPYQPTAGGCSVLAWWSQLDSWNKQVSDTAAEKQTDLCGKIHVLRYLLFFFHNVPAFFCPLYALLGYIYLLLGCVNGDI